MTKDCVCGAPIACSPCQRCSNHCYCVAKLDVERGRRPPQHLDKYTDEELHRQVYGRSREERR